MFLTFPRNKAALAACSLAALALAGCERAPQQTDWALLGNSSDMQHRSELTGINKDNVKDLGLVWSADIPTPSGLVGNPLIKDGRVFQSGGRGFVVANDVKTGKVLWTWQPELDFKRMSLVGKWGSNFNRGVALADGNVIIAVDCKLVALDQKTGKKAWEAKSCDSSDAYAITAAPRVGDGLVFTGNACMDTGFSRGYVDAFDEKTGKHVWRFYTVPGDPSKPQSKFYADAAKTWGKGWYQHTKGCGSVWDAIVYDEKLKRVYIGVDTAAPFTPTSRGENPGDELYSGAVVALDAKTGKYIWHWTIDPHDAFNYTPTGMMIADLPKGDTTQRSVIVVPKNGFVYTLDAESGKFLTGKDYIPQNWAKGLDKDGHPILTEQVQYWKHTGTTSVVLPSGMGGHNWEPMAFDPKTSTLFVTSQVSPMATWIDKSATLGEAAADFFHDENKAYGDLVAWDLVNQKPRWRVKNKMPIDGGVMYTAGGLLFQGTGDGFLNIYDADSGKLLWSRNVGGVVRAGPSTVMVDGKQYVIVPTGNGANSAISTILYKYSSTPKTRSGSRLLAFAIGGKQPLPQSATPLEVPKPSHARYDEGLAMQGLGMFAGSACIECHGWGGRSINGFVPNLVVLQPDMSVLKAVVQDGALEANGMPKFGNMTDSELALIEAYLTNEAWDAYDEQQKKK